MFEMWKLFVQNFLNPIGALEVTFGYKFTPIFVCTFRRIQFSRDKTGLNSLKQILLMAAPVQAFLTWRCWVVRINGSWDMHEIDHLLLAEQKEFICTSTYGCASDSMNRSRVDKKLHVLVSSLLYCSGLVQS